MSRSANPLILHMGLSFVCLILVMLLLPEGTAFWQRALVVIFSITLGHQMGVAILAAKSGRAAMLKAWLECVTFPLLIFAVLKLPETQGWILAVSGLLWRPLIGRLWK